MSCKFTHALSVCILSGLLFSGLTQASPLAVAPVIGTAANPFSTLAQAQSVKTDGSFHFDLNGVQFSTHVISGGWVLVLQDDDTDTGANSLDASTDMSVLSVDNILSPPILASLGDAVQTRLVATRNAVVVVDAVSDDSRYIDAIIANQNLYPGDVTVGGRNATAHHAMAQTWVGTGSNYMGVGHSPATCSGSISLPDSAYHMCGRPATYHLVPSGDSSHIFGEPVSLFSSLYVKAEDTPLKLWLNAGNGLDADASFVRWDDLSGGDHHATKSGSGADPLAVENSLNFNPALDFSGAGGSYLDLNDLQLEEDKIHVYVVDHLNNSSDGTLLSNDNTGWDKQISIGQVDSFDDQSAIVLSGDHLNGKPAVRSYYLEENAVDTSFVSRNGSGRQSFTIQNTVGGASAFISRRHKGGTSTDSGGNLNGRIAEMLVFRGELDVTDQSIVESYLATKYGISMQQTSPFDYLDSAGTAFWLAANNTSYSHNIFAVARDDLHSLDQRVSRSSADGALLTVALDNDFSSVNNSVLRTATHGNDRQFLVFGNNNAALTAQTSELDLAVYNDRIGREWKISATNVSQNVHLKFDGFDSNYAVLHDSDGDFSAGASRLGALDEQGVLNGVNLQDGHFLTLARVNYAPIVPAGQVFSVAENSEAGTAVGAVIGSDPEGHALIWTLISADSPFALSAEGSLTLVGALDESITANYDLDVQADDGARSTAVSVRVNILGVAALGNESVVRLGLSGGSMNLYFLLALTALCLSGQMFGRPGRSMQHYNEVG